MATIKHITDKKGNILHPVTEIDAVLDGATTLSEKLSDLDTIRANAALGSVAYQKPTSGIPEADLEGSIRTLLSNMVLYGDIVGTITD